MGTLEKSRLISREMKYRRLEQDALSPAFFVGDSPTRFRIRGSSKSKRHSTGRVSLQRVDRLPLRYGWSWGIMRNKWLVLVPGYPCH